MFEQVSGSLDFQTKQDEEIFYFVNFSKMENVNDLVKVLSTMGFGISDKNPHYEDIKQFLDLDRPVKLK